MEHSIDKENVITWLEICGKNNDCSGCCPYSENGFGEYGQCRESLMADAYDMLKEQEAELLQQEAELDILRNIYKQENPNKQEVKWDD